MTSRNHVHQLSSLCHLDLLTILFLQLFGRTLVPEQRHFGWFNEFPLFEDAQGTIIQLGLHIDHSLLCLYLVFSFKLNIGQFGRIIEITEESSEINLMHSISLRQMF